ncbi:Unknown protein [Striga hermonthica]|uniref:Ubiquitin-like protease family profile domain-containing protein n=1 Tax=Striga hermonthica TaxID=68872 RepID=A0A9N7NGW8_STRHE|nr:Unknown protein [Striga hermonthica]
MVNSPQPRKNDERVVDGGSTDQPRGGWKVTRRRSGLNESQPSHSSQSVKHAHEANKQMGDEPTHAEDLVNRGKTVVTAGSDDLVDDTSELKRDKIMAAQGAIKRKVYELKRADECSKRANLSSLPENNDFVDVAPQLKRYKNTMTQNAATLALEATGAVPVIGSDDGDVLPSINTRSSSAIFVKAVSGLTDDQKEAVRDMGFGRLLELTITTTPAKMGYWLVDSFNHMDRKLKLYDGEKIHVKEEDVYAALGLPRGTIEVTNKNKKTESELLKEWVRLYNVSKPTKITASRVLDMIQNCHGSDDWFKRNFVVLMVTCLFESTSNGMANLRIIHLLSDLSNIMNMNWCSYMIRCLVSSKKSWNDNRGRKNFTGPLLFLTLFYVDKVVLSIRNVARIFPIFKAWNNELLKARERDEIVAGAFGRGYVDADLCVEDASHRVEREFNIRDDNDMNRTSTISVQLFFKGKRKKDISYKKFQDMFKADFDWIRRYNIKQIAVFVFPVHSGSFSGLMCIVPESQNFYVLDSVGACRDDGVKKTVLARAEILRQWVAKYLDHMNMVKFSKAVALSIPEVVNLDWTEGVDDVDVGVVTMRLMETFKGRITKNWNQDMKKADKGQLELMRKRYCYVIAGAGNNDTKDDNLAAARKFQDLCGGVKSRADS